MQFNFGQRCVLLWVEILPQYIELTFDISAIPWRYRMGLKSTNTQCPPVCGVAWCSIVHCI